MSLVNRSSCKVKRGDKRKRRKVGQVKSVIEKSVNALPADSCRSLFPQSKLWGINRVPLSADCPAQSECNCLQRRRFRPCTPYICTDDVSCERRVVVTCALQPLKVLVNCAKEPEMRYFPSQFYIIISFSPRLFLSFSFLLILEFFSPSSSSSSCFSSSSFRPLNSFKEMVTQLILRDRIETRRDIIPRIGRAWIKRRESPLIIS